MPRLTSPIVLVLAMIIAHHAAAEQRSTAAKLIDSPRVLIIAHRGDSGRAPENTLPAFRSALQSGADLVELDYYHSADGVPVVFHDKTLKRTTDAAAVFGKADVSVGDKRLSELRRLDAGAWFDASFRGTPIPTLDEALEVIQQGSYTLIERKSGDASTCLELLREKNLLQHVVVQAFDWKFIADCHRLAPDLPLGALGGEELTADKLQAIGQTGCRVVGWDQKHLGPAQIAAIHQRGLRAWAYTVNDPARAQELIQAGIDGLITDVPAKLAPLVTSSNPADSPR